jgi:hypothetical protein
LSRLNKWMYSDRNFEIRPEHQVDVDAAPRRRRVAQVTAPRRRRVAQVTAPRRRRVAQAAAAQTPAWETVIGWSVLFAALILVSILAAIFGPSHGSKRQPLTQNQKEKIWQTSSTAPPTQNPNPSQKNRQSSATNSSPQIQNQSPSEKSSPQPSGTGAETAREGAQAPSFSWRCYSMTCELRDPEGLLVSGWTRQNGTIGQFGNNPIDPKWISIMPRHFGCHVHPQGIECVTKDANERLLLKFTFDGSRIEKKENVEPSTLGRGTQNKAGKLPLVPAVPERGPDRISGTNPNGTPLYRLCRNVRVNLPRIRTPDFYRAQAGIPPLDTHNLPAPPMLRARRPLMESSEVYVCFVYSGSGEVSEGLRMNQELLEFLQKADDELYEEAK